jgi:RES domain-containing protein
VIKAWRLIHPRFADDVASGEGAQRYGGRWNHKGDAAVYVSGSVSLAALEVLVHWGKSALGIGFLLYPVDIPDSASLVEIAARTLPAHWRTERIPTVTQEIGSKWLHSLRSAVLKVPSVIVPGEANYVLNPLHPGFPIITFRKPETFSFDRRIFAEGKR